MISNLERLVICGDREWEDLGIILNEVKANKDSIKFIIEGECRGADKLGRLAGQKAGIPVLPFPAKWKIYGKAAGPIRNQQMIDEGKPTEVWAFHNNIIESTGTVDMIKRSMKTGILVKLYFRVYSRAVTSEKYSFIYSTDPKFPVKVRR